ncbi:hypothetical protein BC940DRAFT_297598 [Gongronella butleri]|nr:hypothetical protein BC940DRAFT_297598 [Gongronella butleri]
MLSSSNQYTRDSERIVLPPISTLDEYMPKSTPQAPSSTSTHPYPLLSPPASSATPSMSSNSSFSSSHSPVMAQPASPSPPRPSFEKLVVDAPIYGPGMDDTRAGTQQPSATSPRTLSSDVDRIIQHSRGLYDNMVHYKPYLVHSHRDDLRPWMDDMIAKSNQVLNALLRLRKHQMSMSPPLSVSSSGPSATIMRSPPTQTAHGIPNTSKLTTSRITSPSALANSSSLASAAPAMAASASYTYHHAHRAASPRTTAASPPHHPMDASPTSPTPSSSAFQTHRPSFTPVPAMYVDTSASRKRGWTSATSTNSPARQRKRGKRATFQGRCHSCNISETPEWRRGPDGARTLCNACGLHYAKLVRKKAAASATQSDALPASDAAASS